MAHESSEMCLLASMGKKGLKNNLEEKPNGIIECGESDDIYFNGIFLLHVPLSFLKLLFFSLLGAKMSLLGGAL